MDPLSIIGIVGATAAVVSAFRDGLSLFKSWQKRRKGKRSAEATQVEESLERNPPEVEQGYKNHVSRLGRRFELGDDISNESLARIVERFTRTLTTIIKQSAETNLKLLLQVSENARQESLNVMNQLYQRLHASTKIRHLKTIHESQSIESTAPSCSIHVYGSSLSIPTCQVQIYNHTGDSLKDTFSQIPKANPDITLGGPSLVIYQDFNTQSIDIRQPAHTPNLCNFSRSSSTPNDEVFRSKQELSDRISPLKKRLDEMDQVFGSSFLSNTNITSQPPQTRPTVRPPSVVSHQEHMAPLGAPPQGWYSKYQAPSVASYMIPPTTSQAPAPSAASYLMAPSTQAPPPTLFSDLVYSQPKALSLREKLNAITQRMDQTRLRAHSVSTLSSTSSIFCAVPPPPTRVAPQQPQIPVLGLSERRSEISQWAQSISDENPVVRSASEANQSSSDPFVFPGVRQYTGSVRMTGGLPGPSS